MKKAQPNDQAQAQANQQKTQPQAAQDHHQPLKQVAQHLRDCADQVDEPHAGAAAGAKASSVIDAGKLASILQTIQQILGVLIPLIPHAANAAPPQEQ